MLGVWERKVEPWYRAGTAKGGSCPSVHMHIRFTDLFSMYDYGRNGEGFKLERKDDDEPPGLNEGSVKLITSFAAAPWSSWRAVSS
jgi:hypothetical protein